MSFPPVYTPVIANPNDGELITQCKILDQVGGGTTSVGINGGTYVAASTTVNGSFKAIQFVTAGSLTTATGNITGATTPASYPAGFILYGTFTSVRTNTATVIVYNA